MVKIGDYNKLKVAKEVDFGMYLEAAVNEAGALRTTSRSHKSIDEGEDSSSEKQYMSEILLPKKYIPKGTAIGDLLDVFIYTDSEDRLVATTLTPVAKVGDIAAMVVKDVNPMGAFMEWGLEKDLFVPFNEQHKKMEQGRKYLVKVLLDPKSNRVIASSKLGAFLENKDINLKEGEEVQLIIWDRTNLGYSAIINNKYAGMIYYNEVFKKLDIGDEIKGFIKLVRPDKKIDLTLNAGARESVDEAKDQIIAELDRNKGFLPLHDNSDPEDIKEHLEMSKKVFKKAIGGLYKDKKITITTEGINLINKK